VSAKTGQNVKESFEELFNQVPLDIKPIEPMNI
jgi:hypothetical protein